MPNLRIIADNLADSATLTASPAVAATLPVTNLQLSPRAMVMRSTSTANQQIKGTWASGKVLSGCCLWRHNLSSAGTWRLELFSDTAWTTSVYDSGDVAVYPIKALNELIWGVEPLGANVFTDWGKAFSVMWFSGIAASSFRITLKDAANPDGYMEVARLFLGAALESTYNFDYGHGVEWVDPSTQSRTDGASLRTDAAVCYRSIKFDLNNLTEVDRPKFFDITRLVGKRKEILFSGYPEAGGAKERDYTFGCKIVRGAPVKRLKSNIYSQPFELEET